MPTRYRNDFINLKAERVLKSDYINVLNPLSNDFLLEMFAYSEPRVKNQTDQILVPLILKYERPLEPRTHTKIYSRKRGTKPQSGSMGGTEDHELDTQGGPHLVPPSVYAQDHA